MTVDDGPSPGCAARQVRLLPVPATGTRLSRRLPGNWAEEFHEASKLRLDELVGSNVDGDAEGVATDRAHQALGAGIGIGELETVLAAALDAVSPGVDTDADADVAPEVVVLARTISGLAPGGYPVASGTGALRARLDVDLARFCADVLGDSAPLPAVALAIVSAVPRHDSARELRRYRHGLIGTGRLVRAAGDAAARLGLGWRGRGDFADDAANRLLGLSGTERACTYLLLLDPMGADPGSDDSGSDDSGGGRERHAAAGELLATAVDGGEHPRAVVE